MKTKSIIAPLVGSICLLAASSLFAAPGEISKLPLSSGVGVKPNLLFVIDDSGSMGNEVLARQSAAEIYTFNADAKDGTNHHKGNLDMTPDHPREYLELCVGYNVLAYNPEYTYEPWSGQPQADPSRPKSFATDKSTANVITAPGELKYLRAVDDTYTDDDDRGSGDEWGDYPNGEAVLVLDLEPILGGKADEVGYVPWTDTNGDGLFQVSECGGDQVFSNGNLEDVSYDLDGDGVEDIPTGFVSYSSMLPEEKQNFANWYTYHRKRRFAAIKPLTDIVDENDGLRVGLATINKALPYASQVDDLADANHKQELLDKLYQLGGTEATPLRRPLDNAGRYFTGDPNLPVDQNFVGPNGGESSPILSIEEGGECQQNYTLLFTDGRSNEGRPETYPELGHIQNEDGGPCNESECYNGGVYGHDDKWEDTLGDIAMYYYSIDMKDQYEDKVSSKADPFPFGNPAQHMVTYTVAFGATGEIKNYDPSLDIRTLDDDYFEWPNLDQLSGNDSLWEGERAESIDDLLHAAVNGRGKFLSAADPSTLKSGLEEIVGDVLNASSGSASGVSFNAGSTDAGSVAYQASFDGSTWGGSLQALDFSQGEPVLVCEDEPTDQCDDPNAADYCENACTYTEVLFDADDLLNTRVAASVIDNGQEIGGQSTRNIFTYNGQVTVDFQFPADVMNPDLNKEISQEQVNDLLKNAPAGDAQNYGLQIVQYLRGDNRFLLDYTRYPFRNRLGDTLGAIVHSSPQYVGAPSASYANFIEGENDPYQTFVTTNEDRAPVVYVGANDGMLHAFRAANKLEEDATTGEITSVLDPDGGQELFAYIPKLVFSEEDNAGLHWLADPTYSLQPYVDASPTIQDAFYEDNGGEWRTILAGGLGAGGKGIYVLDVTDPEAIASGAETSPVMIEFSHENLGYTYSRPQIAKLNNGKWGVIFGNGYLNTGTGESSLFILYLDAEADVNGDFTEDEDYIEISTGKGSVDSDCLGTVDDCNGMSSATLVDLNGDGTVDRVYAGDLHGHLWGFDLSDELVSNWGVAHTDSGTDAPLFSACLVDGIGDCEPQPITAAPTVTGHATEGGFSTMPNTFVMFGTGQFLVEDDLDNTSTQSFYGVWDAGIGGLDRDDLVEQTFTDEIVGSETFRSLSTEEVVYDASATSEGFGWNIDFPDAGERSLVSPLVIGDIVLFSSYIPTGNECSVSGSGYLMAAEIFSGGLPDFSVFNGQDLQSAVEITGGEGEFVVNPSNGDITTSGGDGTIEGIEANFTKDRLSRRANWSIIR